MYWPRGQRCVLRELQGRFDYFFGCRFDKLIFEVHYWLYFYSLWATLVKSVQNYRALLCNLISQQKQKNLYKSQKTDRKDYWYLIYFIARLKSYHFPTSTKMQDILSQPSPDEVSLATSISIKSYTIFWWSVPFFHDSWTISIIPWLLSTYLYQMPSHPIKIN
jgi:hypothetical protein